MTSLRSWPELQFGAGEYDIAVAGAEQRTPLGEYLGALVEEGFGMSTTGIALEQAQIRRDVPGSRVGILGVDREDMIPGAGAEPAVMPEDVWKKSDHWRKDLDWDESMTEARATALAKIHDSRKHREWLIGQRQAGLWDGLLGFGAAMAGGLPSAENFVPFLGPVRRAALVARFGPVRGLAAVGAAEGAIGNAAVLPIIAAHGAQVGDDMTLADALFDVAVGAGIGGVLGTGAGAWRRYRGEPMANSPQALAASNDALVDAMDSLATDGGVSVTPDLLRRVATEAEALRKPGAIGRTDVFFDVRDKLTKAGVPDDQAEANAAIWQSAMDSFAARSGRDPGEIYQSLGLSVDRAVPGAGEAGQTLFQSAIKAPPFYSALTKSVEELKQPKASGEQWAGMIRNLASKGVKQEEIDWSGVVDWLNEHDGPVTREDVLGFLRANEVQVREVEKGADSTKALDEQGAAEDAISTAIDALAAKYGHKITFEGEEVYWDEITPRLFWGDIQPKDFDPHMRADVENLVSLNEQRIAARQRAEDTDVNERTKFSSYTLPGGENYRELLLTLPVSSSAKAGTYFRVDAMGDVVGRHTTLRAAENAQGPDEIVIQPGDPEWEGIGLEPPKDLGTVFTGSHWDETNVLAHVRFNERTDADGNRVLFIEEIQSDWHQKGRKKGYLSSPRTKEQFRLELSKLEQIQESGQSLTAEQAQRIEHLDYILNAGGPAGEVPDAPFKRTWPELAFKRMVRYAAENDFDKIAWTTGEQQAGRYDLSKQIDAVEWSAGSEPGKYHVGAVPKGEQSAPSNLLKNDITLDEIADFIGKEMADKIKAQEGKGATHGTLLGADLKVGGEGMRGFYDKMLPAFAAKFGKKFGAKVESAIIPLTNDQKLAALATMDAREGKVAPGIVESAHSLTITPEMREAALKGLPLFQGPSPEGGGARASVALGDDFNSIVLGAKSDPTSFIHESAHVFLNTLSKLGREPDVAPSLKTDWQTVRGWLGVEGDAPLTRDQHERWATAFERYLAEGTPPTTELAGVFARMKAWFADVYRALRDIAPEISPEVRGVMDRMLTADDALSRERMASTAPGRESPEPLPPAPRAGDETVADLAAEHGVTLDGAHDREPDIAILDGEGRLLDAERADLEAADALVERAVVYERAYAAAATCLSARP